MKFKKADALQIVAAVRGAPLMVLLVTVCRFSAPIRRVELTLAIALVILLV